MIHVFVYGTLMPGQQAYPLCAQQVVSCKPAIAQGRLYQLPFGYPAMTVEEAGQVEGTVLSFVDCHVLEQLDDYEQHDPKEFMRFASHQRLEENQYKRIEIDVMIPSLDRDRAPFTAWAYIMTALQIQQMGGALIANGRWQ